jgi:hypothetical protein
MQDELRKGSGGPKLNQDKLSTGRIGILSSHTFAITMPSAAIDSGPIPSLIGIVATIRFEWSMTFVFWAPYL